MKYEYPEPDYMRPEGWRGKERWKPVAGFEKWYRVSNMGRVKTKRKLRVYESGYRRYQKVRFVTPFKMKDQWVVYLQDDTNKGYFRSITKIVADAWLLPRTGDMLIRKDPSVPDFSIYNLKERHYKKVKNRKLTDEQIEEIKRELKEWRKGKQKELAEKLNVRQSTISKLVKSLGLQKRG